MAARLGRDEIRGRGKPCPYVSGKGGRGKQRPYVWLVVLLLALAAPLHARPHVLVILADHLTLDDVSRPDLPNLARMRREGEMALMSPGLARKPDPVANVYAALGAGDSVGVGDVSQGRMADALHRAGVRTALLGDAEGDDTGSYRPALLFLPHPDVVADGTAADGTVPGGKREDPARLWAATKAAFGTCDLVIVHFGDFARAERENGHDFLMPEAYRAHRGRALLALDSYVSLTLDGFHGPVLLVVPTPPLSDNDTWNRLTPFLQWGLSPPSSAGGTVRTDTTQTPGLVSTRDLAPMILEVLGVPQPVQMTGAPGVSVSMPPASLTRLDRLTRLNQEAQDGVFWTIGLGAAALVFASLGLYLSGRMAGRNTGAARYAIRLLCAWPLALLLAPLADPRTVGGYLVVIVGMICLLALLPTPQIIFGLTALVLVGDGLTGTTLVSNSALSEYALAGIRFYGIGNEYMGVLIGGALLVAAGIHPARLRLATFPKREREEVWDQSPLSPPVSGGVPGATEERRGRWVLLALWFALITFVLSFPAFGAKAGGAVTATATFYVAWRLLQGKTVNWRHLLGSVLAGFALILVWAALGHVLHLRRTHLETAVGALGHGRFGYILGVSLRKIGLAARVVTHPGTLAGLLGLALLGLAARKWLWRQVTGYLATRPRDRAVWQAGLWGCLVALLFNDSGIVAAILILQCLVLSLLHGLFGDNECASSGWTSATSASASPSATL